MKRIVITGATGLIGSHITSALIARGEQVTILSRSVENAERKLPGAAEYIKWNIDGSDWYSSLENKDAVIHLAGENIMAKKWDEHHKRNILTSRTEGTKAVIDAINSLANKPKIFVAASAIGYYGNTNESVDENSKPGKGFLTEVTKAWEDASSGLDNDVRKVIIRVGIVLDKNGGTLSKMIPAFKYFVGGSIGSGKQWLSWIHIKDVVGIFLYAIENENISGILNATSPSPVNMKTFAKTLGKVLHRPSLIKVPAVFIRIIFKEASEVILGGVPAIPKNTVEAGYKFKFSDLYDTLSDILEQN